MARHNVGDVELCRADALRPVTRDAVVLADPARRRAGRRQFDPRDYTPPLDGLLEAYRDRDLVVKCAPGIDFDELGRLGFSGEIEVTSLDGSVREACLWSSSLAEAGVSRRATLLDGPEQITDAEPDDCPVAPVGRWIVDPDGAVVRAGLVRHYAARHRALAARPRHRLPVRRPAARRRARLRGARRTRLQREAAASGPVGTRRRRRRDSGARRRRRPRRAPAEAEAAWIATGLGGDHPHRLRHRKSGNGIHMPAVAMICTGFLSQVLWRRRLRCRSGSGGFVTCAFPRRFSPPRRP